jgi:hypothetical protein
LISKASNINQTITLTPHCERQSPSPQGWLEPHVPVSALQVPAGVVALDVVEDVVGAAEVVVAPVPFVVDKEVL